MIYNRSRDVQFKPQIHRLSAQICESVAYSLIIQGQLSSQFLYLKKYPLISYQSM